MKRTMADLSILGTGGYVLPTTDNESILRYLRAPKTAAWFEAKTGVPGHSLNFDCGLGQKRSSEHVLDYAEHAARLAIERADVSAQQIDQLYLATCTPAYPHFMADAIELHRRLGLRSTVVINQVDGACAALAKAMQDVQAYAQHRPEWRALIVAANDVSSFLPRGPRSVPKGAGCLVIARAVRRWRWGAAPRAESRTAPDRCVLRGRRRAPVSRVLGWRGGGANDTRNPRCSRVPDRRARCRSTVRPGNAASLGALFAAVGSQDRGCSSLVPPPGELAIGRGLWPGARHPHGAAAPQR